MDLRVGYVEKRGLMGHCFTVTIPYKRQYRHKNCRTKTVGQNSNSISETLDAMSGIHQRREASPLQGPRHSFTHLFTPQGNLYVERKLKNSEETHRDTQDQCQAPCVWRETEDTNSGSAAEEDLLKKANIN